MRNAAVSHDGLNICKVEVDDARVLDQVGDALDTLLEDFVRHAEGIHDGGIRIARLEELVVRDDDDGVYVLLQELDALLRMFASLAALELEGLCDDCDGQDTEVLTDLGDNRRRTCTGTAAHAGCDEDHVRAGHGLRDLFHAFLSGSLANLRVAACAEAFGELLTDLQLVLRLTLGERLLICVDSQELDTLELRVDHSVDGVAAAAADTDDDNSGAGFFTHLKLQHLRYSS